MGNEIWLAVRWWVALFVLGLASYPLTRYLFRNWWDKGYLFAKAVGLVIVTYIVWLCASLHILPFTSLSVYIVMLTVLILGIALRRLNHESEIWDLGIDSELMKKFGLFILEELFFFGALYFWAWVKGHEPSIHGLEKFMDYGFARSIFNSRFFPPPDMWYSGGTINYYYFGHFVMALISKVSAVDLRYGFNLMLASLFAFTFTMSFSIGYQLLSTINKFTGFIKSKQIKYTFVAVLGGLLTAYLVSFAGNMQTIYAYTKGYTGENVKPFWELLWSRAEFWGKLTEGMNTYWYANATRFIPWTIHEFPSYSFVVSDVHGHVLSLPYVILAIALLFNIFGYHEQNIRMSDRETSGVKVYPEKRKAGQDDQPEADMTIRPVDGLAFGILGAVLFMTNVLDAPIYMALFFILGAVLLRPGISHIYQWMESHGIPLALAAVAGPAILPFVFNFKSFVTGLAVNCPPQFMAEKKVGLFLFETVDKCQKSPLWMMWLLWGFFIYCGIWLIISNFKLSAPVKASSSAKSDLAKTDKQIWNRVKHFFSGFSPAEKVLMVMFVYSVGLIIFPEFFYFKDIYPQHFRSNTMFKLGYQAFIMFSIISGYAITKILSIKFFGKITDYPSTSLRTGSSTSLRTSELRITNLKAVKIIFLVLLIPQLFLVSVYPTFSIKSYFGKLGNYQTLDGLAWFAGQYPDDYAAVQWLNQKISTHESGFDIYGDKMPVILEADGDSYTDYARVSAYTGLPTVIGWAVHEWLWRGTYDIVAPRREDVRQIYEEQDIELTRKIIARYQVKYVFIGTIEREKYSALNEEKFAEIGMVVFNQGETKIFRLD